MALIAAFVKRSKEKNRQGEKVRQKKNKRKKQSSLPWYIRPGDFLAGRLPDHIRTRLYNRTQRYFRHSGYQDDNGVKEGCRRFLAEEVALLFWGLILIIVLIGVSITYGFLADDTIALKRNPFGKGEKEQELLLKDKEGTKRVSVNVEERELSSMEKEALFRKFFGTLKYNMRGKNKTLKSVNRKLIFDDSLDGFPFGIEYQPEDYSLIGLSGELGEEARGIKEGSTKETRIRVTATYRGWEESDVVTVILTAPDKKAKLGLYEQVKKKLQHMEETSRREDVVLIPGKLGDVKIKVPDSGGGFMSMIFLVVLCLPLLILRKFYKLKEQDEIRKKEEEEDFPLIVHLLSLYMKSGLSFSSAVHRISRNYQENLGPKERTAFMDIVIMDKQLSMGVSQKEACISWGRRSSHPMYQKLSAALVQILVKGSKEGDRILGHMEREAFEHRIERARKEGNTAQTRLLFPMMILLCLVMIIVLFPAIIRFQGF